MNSEERILRTIRGEEVDRIPIYVPTITGRVVNTMGIPAVADQDNYLIRDGIPVQNDWMKKDLSYLEIIEFAKKACERVWTYEFPEFDRRFLLIPKEFIETPEFEENIDILTSKYQVNSPKGELEYIAKKEKNISTVWTEKPLVCNKQDAEKILSIPYTFQKPDIDDFFRNKKRIKEKGGFVYIWVSTPLVCVSQLFRFTEFLTWCITEKKMIAKLIEIAFERIYQQLEYLLQNGVGPIFRFGGSEQATPPMMSPKLYDEFVVKYDKQLFDLVHKYGCYVEVHCHGRIKSVLNKMIKMGVDLTDPVEPPPNGDVEIGEARRMVGNKMTLVGNIEFSDLEYCSPKEIDEKVKQVIYEGGRKRFILATSAGPITFVSKRLKENYIQFIKSGIKYGQFR